MAATATLVVDRLPLIAIMRRRVVVTGIGAITPIGITGRQLWDGVRAERSRCDADEAEHGTCREQRSTHYGCASRRNGNTASLNASGRRRFTT